MHRTLKTEDPLRQTKAAIQISQLCEEISADAGLACGGQMQCGLLRDVNNMEQESMQLHHKVLWKIDG